MSSGKGWIGVDLDGTLAHYDGWVSEAHIGDPVPRMAARVTVWLSEEKDVRIFTARVSSRQGASGVARNREIIQDWTQKHFGVRLLVTCEKDFQMVELWDDRCVQMTLNTGVRTDGKEG